MAVYTRRVAFRGCVGRGSGFEHKAGLFRRQHVHFPVRDTWDSDSCGWVVGDEPPSHPLIRCCAQCATLAARHGASRVRSRALAGPHLRRGHLLGSDCDCYRAGSVRGVAPTRKVLAWSPTAPGRTSSTTTDARPHAAVVGAPGIRSAHRRPRMSDLFRPAATPRRTLLKGAGGLALGAIGLDGVTPRAMRMAAAPSRQAMTPTAGGTDDATAVATDAYVYCYPLVSMDVTRRQVTNVAAGKQFGRGPMNTFVNATEYVKADNRDVVRTNFDTLFSYAWLDLTREPVIVSVPDTDGRYYLLPMLDMWTSSPPLGSGPPAPAWGTSPSPRLAGRANYPKTSPASTPPPLMSGSSVARRPTDQTTTTRCTRCRPATPSRRCVSGERPRNRCRRPSTRASI